jgi:hypothetical protein
MFAIFEFRGILEGLFVSIPESVGLLAFGLGLMGAAATGRWLLSRSEAKKGDETSQSEV